MARSASLELTLDRTIDALTNGPQTREARALLIEARRLRSVIGNWRSIPPPADVRDDMVDRVIQLSTAVGVGSDGVTTADASLDGDGPDVEPQISFDTGANTDDDFYSLDFEPHLYSLEGVTMQRPAIPPPPQQAVAAGPAQPSIDFEPAGLRAMLDDEIPIPPAPLGRRARLSEPPPTARRAAVTARAQSTMGPQAARSPGAVARAVRPAPVAPAPVAAAPAPRAVTPVPAARPARRVSPPPPPPAPSPPPPPPSPPPPPPRVSARPPAPPPVDVPAAPAPSPPPPPSPLPPPPRVSARPPAPSPSPPPPAPRESEPPAAETHTPSVAPPPAPLPRADLGLEPPEAGDLGVPRTLISVEAVKLGDPIPRELVFLTAQYGASADAYRAMRRKLASGANPRVIGVTSAHPGEGKTVFALNLALALRESARGRVLVVEVNHRAPRFAKLLGFSPSACILRQLASHVDDPRAPWIAQEPIPKLHVMAIDPKLPRDPLIDPVAFGVGMERLKQAGYDYLIVDSPPVLGSVDCNVISDSVEGMIFTALTMKSKRREMRKAVEQIEPAPIFGVVVIET